MTKRDRSGTVLVETTLQIERQKARGSSRRVEAFLSGFRFTATSSYSRLEFKRAWLRDLAYLHVKCSKCSRLEDVEEAIQESFAKHPSQRRRLNRCWQALNSFQKRLPGSEPYNQSVFRIRMHIEEALLTAYDWWDASVTHEYTGTSCVRAEERPMKGKNGRIDCAIPDCSPNKIACRIHEFFVQDQSKFDAVEELATSGKCGPCSSELSSSFECMENARRDPKTLCDNRVCAKMGDLIIAVDGSDMECFAANNDNEWSVISRALGKKLENPVSAKE